MQALGATKSENAARFLSLLYPSMSDKKLQKLIKKSLFHLKTQGVRVDEPIIPGESALRKVETGRETHAFLSNYDEAMTRVALTGLAIKKNQILMTNAVLHYSDGLAELSSFPVSKDEFGNVVKDFLLHTSPEMVLVPISPAYAGYLIEEGAGRSGKNIDDARDLHHVLSSMPGDVKRPNDISRLDAPDAASDLSADVLFGDEIFAPFLLKWPSVEEDRKKLDEVVKPSIILPPYAIEERRQAFLTELVGSGKMAASLSLFKRALEDYAYLFYCLKKFDHYKSLLARLSSQDGLKSAFLRFVEKTFEELEEADKQQPGVLVDPFSNVKK